MRALRQIQEANAPKEMRTYELHRFLSRRTSLLRRHVLYMYSTCMLYRACVYRLVRSPTRSLTRCRCTRYTAARAARPSTSGMQRPANDEPRTLRAPNTEFCPQDRQSLSVSYRCGAHMTLCNGAYCTTRPSTRPAPTTPSDRRIRRIRRIRQPPSAQRSEQQILQLDPQLLGLTHLHSVTAVRSVVPEHLPRQGGSAVVVAAAC